MNGTTTMVARLMVVELTSHEPLSQGADMPLGLGIPELIVILFIIILIFGASRLPEIGRGIGKGIRNFKEATRDGGNRDDR
jgi:sec-independent protein translocase protein TatA